MLKTSNYITLNPGMVNLLSHVKMSDNPYSPLFSKYTPSTNNFIVKKGGSIFGKLFSISSQRPN